jgi:hypothetical protein
MGNIKADSILPTNNGNNLILRTGVGDVERVRISPSGDITVNGSFSTSVTGNINVVGNVGITGGLSVTGGETIFGGSRIQSGGLSVTGGASITGNIRINATTLSPVGSAPSYTARAWVSFDASGTIFGGGNVSSVSNPSQGLYNINFITPMTTTGYAIAPIVTDSGSNRAQMILHMSGTNLTGSFQIRGGQVESNTLLSLLEPVRSTISVIGD